MACAPRNLRSASIRASANCRRARTLSPLERARKATASSGSKRARACCRAKNVARSWSTEFSISLMLPTRTPHERFNKRVKTVIGGQVFQQFTVKEDFFNRVGFHRHQLARDSFSPLRGTERYRDPGCPGNVRSPVLAASRAGHKQTSVADRAAPPFPTAPRTAP